MATPPRPGSTGARRLAVGLGLALSILALFQAHHRAGQGRGALLKWGPVFEALERGEPIYQVGAEGYPTLPLSLLLLEPFHRAGEVAGPLLWAAAQLGLAWWIVTSALALAAGRARDFPGWGALLVLLLAFRVLLSDVLHGNLNLLVGATIAAAAWEWRRGRELRSGLWIGLGAVLKVTPALGLAFFLWKRSRAGVGGVLGGALAFAFVLPGLWLGFDRNLELASSWWEQMIRPYLAGRELGLTQTEHINQSLFGVLARLTTDSVAIVARPGVFDEDVRIHLVALGPGAFRAVHLSSVALVLAFAARCIARRPARGASLAILGEFSVWTLAMVFLSERSWKHHYVLLAFPIAFLVFVAARAPRASFERRLAVLALAASAALHGLTGSAVLGARGSDLAEAYGVYLAGGLSLFIACGLILVRETTRAGVETPARDGSPVSNPGQSTSLNRSFVAPE